MSKWGEGEDFENVDWGLTGCRRRFLGEAGANSLSESLERQPSGLRRLREKSLLRIESGPRRLKPDLFLIRYVWANARCCEVALTLQQP
jgi:hypothetical protein